MNTDLLFHFRRNMARTGADQQAWSEAMAVYRPRIAKHIKHATAASQVLLKMVSLYPIEKQYEFGSVLGMGGFGTVYAAKDLHFGAHVAIKQQDLTGKKARPSDLVTELLILSQVNHPNVLGMIDAYLSGVHLYIVIEFMDAGDLHDLRRKLTPMSAITLATIMKQLFQGLEHLHSLGIIHMDLKPANVLLSTDGTLKINDFGLSNLIRCEGDTCDIPHGAAYIQAPEMHLRKPYGTKVDIWAAGLIMVYLVEGYTPFLQDHCGRLLTDKQSRRAVLKHRWAGVPPSSSEWAQGPMKFAYTLLKACMEPKPVNRPSARILLSYHFIQRYGMNPADLEPVIRQTLV